ncbi:MAG: hypothetical protein N3E45_15655 [Oscillatoriaceae bacterium SKW80]|nr:hypothetical protein [Oscillatoriaceae bacterium SKYG93]MCX8122233.1 hypothetical protein [Oscillatoriaceae bacterium SKW80]MDW8454519.1 hypothetical protein [Oscillatoriaceae cyanobacterium SKYGB_i_bin93]
MDIRRFCKALLNAPIFARGHQLEPQAQGAAKLREKLPRTSATRPLNR